MTLKLGRLPGQIPAGLRDLTFYSAGPLPKPPPSVTIPAVPAWGMDGNDVYGDCGVAGITHGFQAAAADTRETEAFPPAAEVISYYLKYTGGQDSGVVLSQFLAYVRAHGFYGHSVAAYAPVAVHDVPTLQFCIDAYDFAYVGITVTQGMMDAAQGPGPWTWTAEDAAGAEIGGHCIILVAYDSQWLYGVTWGQVVRIAYPAWHRMSDEAWAVLPGEIRTAGTDGHGINIAALNADMPRLDGTAGQPAAGPAGHEGLLGELAAAVRDVAASTEKDVTELLSFLASKGL